MTRIGFIRALLPIVGLVIGERAQRGRIVNDDEKRGKKKRKREKKRKRGSAVLVPEDETSVGTEFLGATGTG